eukprot:CAMPEP_0198236010 /NCGR_PEP_ID=MMETSP1446-20131203/1934_1 /TAXON_ID=1461542 ORGANISM="Unidentified sp, Strain CCMP2111" /NCGR_SAMPLE_ID=MMETSP1446 /ASSEMBLY_ACC=CAM_ASM_001112 /LENGTH=87 /DNA_ID=CAMNT_0043917549 /DNA_START=362 /DNA_END=622 /DNA_ORIENTATION=+
MDRRYHAFECVRGAVEDLLLVAPHVQESAVFAPHRVELVFSLEKFAVNAAAEPFARAQGCLGVLVGRASLVLVCFSSLPVLPRHSLS